MNMMTFRPIHTSMMIQILSRIHIFKDFSVKKINIVYSDSEYSICSVPDGESGYLKQYDEIIVEGTDLYDGCLLYTSRCV